MISVLLKKYQSKVHAYSKLGIKKAKECPEIVELIDIWNNEGLAEKTGHSEEAFLEILNESIAPVQLRLVNQRAKQRVLSVWTMSHIKRPD